MARAKNTDETGEAQARFVVSLPAETGKMIDRVGARLSAAFKEQTGVAFDLSRAQIVQALVRQALADDPGEASESNGKVEETIAA